MKIQNTLTESKARKYNKKLFKVATVAMAVATIVVLGIVTVFAAENAAETGLNNLKTFMFSLTRAIGIILLLWGIVQFGIAMKSHDPSQRATSLLTVAGGLIITFAKEILTAVMQNTGASI